MKDVIGRKKCCMYSFVYLLSFLCEDVDFWNVEGAQGVDGISQIIKLQNG